ncbi:MAG: metallophosphoesterase, partial [Clostridia bacterium]|nr:metallophosphoesterase [Clostridia bacterium]
MALFAIADVHLSLGSDKPMDIFGPAWSDHVARLEAGWRETVDEADTVLIPGDVSWAMDFNQLLPDLRFLDALPGEKILSRGNHDYWWSTFARMEAFTAAEGLGSIRFLKNNAYVRASDVICGSRGWILPWDADFTRQDAKVLERERGRLRLSLSAAASAEEDRREGVSPRRVAMLHYPPTDQRFRPSPFTDLLEEFEVSVCVYGHLHGMGARLGPDGESARGVRFVNTSADFLGFRPLRI